MSQMTALQREIAEAVRVVIREEVRAALEAHREPPAPYLTVAEAAQELRVQPRTIRRRIADGSLASVRRAGKLYIPREAVQ